MARSSKASTRNTSGAKKASAAPAGVRKPARVPASTTNKAATSARTVGSTTVAKVATDKVAKGAKEREADRALRAAKPAQAAAASTPMPDAEAPRKREKLVRDSFTTPKSEYAVIGELKQRANTLARPAKKSELLRAGIKALAAMDDAMFVAALRAVPAIKTGRPAGNLEDGAPLSRRQLRKVTDAGETGR